MSLSLETFTTGKIHRGKYMAVCEERFLHCMKYVVILIAPKEKIQNKLPCFIKIVLIFATHGLCLHIKPSALIGQYGYRTMYASTCCPIKAIYINIFFHFDNYVSEIHLKIPHYCTKAEHKLHFSG